MATGKGSTLPTDVAGRRTALHTRLAEADTPVPAVNIDALPDEQINDLFENMFHGPELPRKNEKIVAGKCVPDKSGKSISLISCPRCKARQYRQVSAGASACSACGYWRFE